MSHSRELRNLRHTHTRNTSINIIDICTIAFSAELNGFQVDQVDRENDKQTSTCTQLVPSKLIAACNARIQ